jgi:hypothetical protein
MEPTSALLDLASPVPTFEAPTPSPEPPPLPEPPPPIVEASADEIDVLVESLAEEKPTTLAPRSARLEVALAIAVCVAFWASVIALVLVLGVFR